jgi:NAD(P)-dependent dehydrogenase (short-subunit alcohol dehydrogenase family)
MFMDDLRGKHAFITGGASGIGLGIAKACAEAGMRISIADKRGDLFIFMSPEYKDGMRAKFDAILRAFPTNVEPDPERVYVYKNILRGLFSNPIYETQKQR